MRKLLEVALWGAYLLLSCAALGLVARLAAFVRRERKVGALEEDYAARRSYREDVVHHYYRAKEDSDQGMMDSLRPRLIRATKDLQSVREEYARISAPKPKTA